jgi:hypothetical protein
MMRLGCFGGAPLLITSACEGKALRRQRADAAFQFAPPVDWPMT